MKNYRTGLINQIINIFENNIDSIIDTWINLLIENEKKYADTDS